MTSVASDDDVDDDDDCNAVTDYTSATVTSQNENSIIDRAIKSISARLRFLSALIQTEMWAIFVSVLMQDGPYAIVRLISIIGYGIVTYTNYFFTGKNVFVLILQIYRIVAIYKETQAQKLEAREQKKAMKLAKHYENAFLKLQEEIQKREALADQRLIAQKENGEDFDVSGNDTSGENTFVYHMRRKQTVSKN